MKESFKQLFLGLYSMVVADNETDPREMEALYQIGRDYGLTNDEINDAIINSKVELYTPVEINEKIRFLCQLAVIAWADGKVVEPERELLKQTAKRLRFLDENLDEIVEFLLEKAKVETPIEDVIMEINNN